MFWVPNQPSETSTSDRRKSGRLNCDGAVCQFGPLSDLSKGGCKVVSKKSLSIPDGQTVNVKLEAAGASMLVPARLAMCRKRPDGKYDLGFEFKFINEAMGTQLLRFARHAADSAEYKPN